MAFFNNRVKVRHCVLKLILIGDEILLVRHTGGNSTSTNEPKKWPIVDLANAIECFNECVEDIMGDGYVLIAEQ